MRSAVFDRLHEGDPRDGARAAHARLAAARAADRAGAVRVHDERGGLADVSSAEEPLDIRWSARSARRTCVAYLRAREIYPLDAPDIEDRRRRGGRGRGAGKRDVVLAIDERYGEDFGTAHAARVTVIFDGRSSALKDASSACAEPSTRTGSRSARLRLVAHGVDPTLLRPLIVDDLDVSTSAGRSVLMLGMLTYFLLFATLSGGMHLAIDTTAGERERKSLEPLLTLPVHAREPAARQDDGHGGLYARRACAHARGLRRRDAPLAARAARR